MARGWADTRGGGYSFMLAIWVCTSVARKSTVFQSNLYCKTIIRFSPSFRKNFFFTQKPMMIIENLKKSIRVKASRPLVILCFRYVLHGSYCRFSHDVTKFQTSELLILLRFYFHDVLKQLKTNIHTNFHSEWVLGLVIDYA